MGSCSTVETKMIVEPKTLQDIFPKQIIQRRSKPNENFAASEKQKMATSKCRKVRQVPFLKPLGENKLYKTRLQNDVTSMDDSAPLFQCKTRISLLT